MKLSAKNLFRFINVVMVSCTFAGRRSGQVNVPTCPTGQVFGHLKSVKQIWGVLTGALAMMLTVSAANARSVLTYDDLMTGTYPATVDYSAYLPDPNSGPPTNTFEGNLSIAGGLVPHFLWDWDPIVISGAFLPVAYYFPVDFDYEFVQDGGNIIPVPRGPLPSSHPLWEFVLETGNVWNEGGDHGYTRASIPFSFKQKGADCTHNGVMMFLFNNEGAVSRTAFQIAGETCVYLKVDLWGLQATTYTPHAVADKVSTTINERVITAMRLPIAPISQLATDFPGVNPKNFAMSAVDKTAVYGVVVNGTNYVGGCQTRTGNYPYCDVLDLPSYSTAKSIFASLAFMNLSMVFPSLKDELVADWVPECKISEWSGVKVADLLNMATGNYDSKLYLVDEDNYGLKTKGLFVPFDHASKLKYSCEAYLRRDTPGTTWNYHTSDYYILGTILNKVAKSKAGKDLGDVMRDIFRNLGLSQTIRYTRHTYDADQQPLTGWGLTLHHDDMARIAKFLGSQHGRIGFWQQLDPALLDIAMQRNPAERGLYVPVPGFDNYKYSLGFWAANLQGFTCKDEFWLPHLYGTIGINVLLFPDDAVYYSFADDQYFDWSKPVMEMKKVTPYCK